MISGCAPARHDAAPAIRDAVESRLFAEKLGSATYAEVKELADRGDTLAMVELAFRHGGGRDVEKDEAQAIKLLERAIALKEPYAMYAMGVARVNGIGGPVSDEQALIWYARAADLGHTEGEYWAGFMTGYGRGTEPSWERARPYFEKAAAKNHPDAQFMLGWMYETGTTVPVDVQKAAYWYRRATAQVLNQKAQFNLLSLIERGLVEWQIGDPGAPRPPTPAAAK